jgi:hypothetical protein
MGEAAAAAARRGQCAWTGFEALLDTHVAAPNRDGECLESLHLDDGLSVSASVISVMLDLAWERDTKPHLLVCHDERQILMKHVPTAICHGSSFSILVVPSQNRHRGVLSLLPAAPLHLGLPFPSGTSDRRYPSTARSGPLVCFSRSYPAKRF